MIRISSSRRPTLALIPSWHRVEIENSVAIGLLSLFFSGMASLAAQVIIQKYVSVLCGGMNAITMNMVAFLFVSGLGFGGLSSGILAKRLKNVRYAWCALECAVGAACFFFIPVFSILHQVSFSGLAPSGYFNRVEFYYLYVFLLNAVVAFPLAFAMGFNFPLAFETIRRNSKKLNPSAITILMLTVNAAGAALGAFLTGRIVIWVDLNTTLQLATASYLAAGLLALLVGISMKTRWRGNAAKDRGGKKGSRHESLGLHTAAFLTFLSGLVGFSLETFVLRVNSIKDPLDHTVYGTTVAVYLVLWSLGCALSSFNQADSQKTFRWFAYAWAAGTVLVLNYTRNIPNWAMLFPALFSGWVYGQIYNDVRKLTSFEVGALTFFNIFGCFLGGIATGFIFPSLFSVFYIFPVLLALLTAGPILVWRGFLTPRLGAVCGLVLSAVFLLVPNPHIRFFKSLYSVPKESLERFDLKEDWSGIGVVKGNDFYVGGICEVPGIDEPYGGSRDVQLLVPSILRKNNSMAVLGIAFGLSNGLLAKLNPASSIINWDFFQSLPFFWRAYHNVDLLYLPNSHFKLLDGRLGLELSNTTFDMIADFTAREGFCGISSVKSLEFYQIVKSKLKEGGAFFAISRSWETQNTLKRVFKHVYKFPDVSFMLASDSTIEELVDPRKLRNLFIRYPIIRKQITQNKKLANLKADGSVSLIYRELNGGNPENRIVMDSDPIADYDEILHYAYGYIVNSP